MSAFTGLQTDPFPDFGLAAIRGEFDPPAGVEVRPLCQEAACQVVETLAWYKRATQMQYHSKRTTERLLAWK